MLHHPRGHSVDSRPESSCEKLQKPRWEGAEFDGPHRSSLYCYRVQRPLSTATMRRRAGGSRRIARRRARIESRSPRSNGRDQVHEACGVEPANAARQVASPRPEEGSERELDHLGAVIADLLVVRPGAPGATVSRDRAGPPIARLDPCPRRQRRPPRIEISSPVLGPRSVSSNGPSTRRQGRAVAGVR